jgi:serine/threonine protein kinase
LIDNEGNPHVAVKELTSAQGLTPEKFKEVANNESIVLDRFRKQCHPHLITLIGYYTQGNRHFFIFPWAKGGNLRDFWHSQPNLSTPSLNFSSRDWVSYLNWFFAQLVGLAEAIKILHHPPEGTGVSCRHGDLKPENILCFGKQELRPGNIPTGVKLVVADAGHAKVHEKATEFRGEKTSTLGGTKMYSPPEAELRPEEARSRRYDIWSLGCLYLEFLIWILYGNDVLETFRGSMGKDQAFYEKGPAVVAMKEVVKKWIKAIRDDPRCSPAGLTALGRLADLIEDRLLVANVVIRCSDSIPQDNCMESMVISDTPSNVDKPMLLVTRPTLPSESSESVHPERANAIEVSEEMEKIFDAAKKGDSLPWINWDGMEQAATLGPPQIQSHLAERPGTGAVGARSKSDLTPGVRYRVPLGIMQGSR